MKLFEEVEGNLYNSEDPTVLNSLHDLRRETHLTKQILGDRMKGQKHLIPPVLFQARKATTSDMTYPVPEGYVPLPLINLDIDVRLWCNSSTTTYTNTSGNSGTIHPSNICWFPTSTCLVKSSSGLYPACGDTYEYHLCRFPTE